MKIKKMLRAWRIPIACSLCLLFVFKVVLMIGYVPSNSMEPTISKGSLIFGVRLYGELQCGDVIIFEKEGKNVVKESPRFRETLFISTTIPKPFPSTNRSLKRHGSYMYPHAAISCWEITRRRPSTAGFGTSRLYRVKIF